MFSCYDIRNSPLRLLFDALYYNKRDVVMFLLNHEGFKNSLMVEPNLLFLQQENYPTLTGSLVDILYLACKKKLLNVVELLVRTFHRHLKPSMIFVCLYEMSRFYIESGLRFPRGRFELYLKDLYVEGKREIIWHFYPFLLPLCIGRLRGSHTLLGLPSDVFKYVIMFLEPELMYSSSLYDCVVRNSYIKRYVFCCNDCEPNRYFFPCDCYAFYQ